MKNDGVTFVFNAAEVLAGETLVAEAQKINYAPTWTANRNNTTDTVAKFFKPVADAWNGANGVSVTWPDSDFSQETKDCNAAASKGGLFSYTPDENAYAAYGQYCIMMDLIAQGIKGVSGDLTQPAFLKSMHRDRHHPQQLGTGRNLGRGEDRCRRLRLPGEVHEDCERRRRRLRPGRGQGQGGEGGRADIEVQQHKVRG